MTTFEVGDRVRFTPPGFRRRERTGEVVERHADDHGTTLYVEADTGTRYQLDAGAVSLSDSRPVTDGGVDQSAAGTEHEFVFYLYEQDEEDPRFSFWLETSDGSGMSLYERPPDGHGMWLKPSEGSDHDAIEPTDDLKQVIAELMAEDVSAERVHDLDPHERCFVQVVHGTVEQNPDAIPDPVWGWMHDCADRQRETGTDQATSNGGDRQ